VLLPLCIVEFQSDVAWMPSCVGRDHELKTGLPGKFYSRGKVFPINFVWLSDEDFPAT
jgi:hypothetical protein